jgi:DNA-binding CsgD family transcriptional regulator
MIERAQARRRGRGAGLSGVLAERSAELELLRDHLEEAGAGRGGVALIEAPAGKGKSRLLTIAGDLAREAGMQVLGAQASELERDFPFGLAVQLFEPRWAAADASELERLLRGPARHAGHVLSGVVPTAGQSPAELAFAAIHGFYWLCINLLLDADNATATRPMAILVDDAHWADRPSLRLLAYLAERIADAPIALIVTVRAGESACDEQALGALRRAASETTLHPGSLSADGVAEVVRAQFPHAETAFCQACAAVTNGNPFLLTELLAQLKSDDWPPTAASAQRLASTPPESVMRAVLTRMEALPAEAALVTRAVAIWGAEATPASIAQLTGLDLETVTRAADALSAVHLLFPGTPLGFVHPLIAAAVRRGTSPLDAGRMHRRAASILSQAGASPEQVAAHLLHTAPEHDPEAVEVLRGAARKALASEAPESAVRLLQRARAEHPSAVAHPGLLADLAQAEVAAGHSAAVGRLREALDIVPEGRLRDRLALAHGRALYEHGCYREAAETLESMLANALPGSDPAAQEGAAVFIAAAFFLPELRGRAEAHAQALLERVGSDPPLACLDALAHLAVHGSLHGEHRSRVASVARLAWCQGALLSAPSIEGLAWPLLAAALVNVGECDFALEICEAALARAREQSSPGVFAAASWCRAWVLYELGHITQAAADAESGLDAPAAGWLRYMRSAYSVMALCHIEMGELERAETALSIVDHPDGGESIHLPSLLEARAQLRLAQRRFTEARDDALAAGASLADSFGPTGPAAVAWRSTAALAHLALGQPSGARQLAGADLQDALKADLPQVTVRNLRILGLAEGGEAGLELLAQAVARGAQGTPGLERARALLDYGAALRRANQRSAAREPLREVFQFAQAAGATVLARRAADELAASGARKTRLLLSGVESLTPSERRVADIAARGLTTRQIAESLFVTPKTVEFHLRHIYQKLDIGSRSELTARLASSECAPTGPGGSVPDGEDQ